MNGRSHAFARRLAAFGAVALVCALLPAVALSGEPGTSPLEQAAGAAASEIAGKAVRVRCHDHASWAEITAANGVRSTAFGLAFVNGTVAELAPVVCSALDDLWSGSPLACTTVVSVKVTTKVRAWVTVRKRVRVLVDGAWVYRVRSVRVRKLVDRTSTRSRSEPWPCVAPIDRARAVHTLAHETMHLVGHKDEVVTHCFGLQQVERLHGLMAGVSGRPAASLAWADYRDNPVWRAYFNADCRDGGPLDLTPGDGVWP